MAAEDTVAEDGVVDTEVPHGFTGDEERPFTAAEIAYLHEWGLDYKIVENQRRHDQADEHDEGVEPDKAKALAEAGIHIPPPPANPSWVDGSPITIGTVVPSPDGNDEDADEAEPFDEEAVREELNTWTVPEIKAELKERKVSYESDANKATVLNQLIDVLRSEHDAETDDNDD